MIHVEQRLKLTSSTRIVREVTGYQVRCFNKHQSQMQPKQILALTFHHVFPDRHPDHPSSEGEAGPDIDREALL